MQRKFKIPTGISSLLDGNTLGCSEKGKASLLNTYFSRVYTKESMKQHNLMGAYCILYLVITPKAVKVKLRMLCLMIDIDIGTKHRLVALKRPLIFNIY